jgi:hypothetical protein
MNPELYDGIINAITRILARYGEEDALRVAARYEHSTGIDRMKLMGEARKLQFVEKSA